MADIIRAYSTLDIKSMDEDSSKRRFSGTASTPNTDKMGDIVEPKGAVFQLPIPLLWQHRSSEPVGWVRACKVTDKGIEVDCELAVVTEPGRLKDRLDEAWQSLRAKLVRGLSIGFRPLESTRIENTYAYRYIKWAWDELSAVTIPANEDCSIASIKSADQAIRRAALGARPVVRLDLPPAASGNSTPGVSGQQPPRRKGVVYLNDGA